MKNTNTTAKETKMFSYSGSKMKYKEHFENAHKKIQVKSVHTYIEAFSGTLSSMFHNLASVTAERIIINDINASLINLYRQIKSNHNEVIETYTMLEKTFQEHIPSEFKNQSTVTDKVLREEKLSHLRDFYHQSRDIFNTKENTPQNAGVMIFMLNHNFNGLYSEAKKTGNFNIAFNWNVRKVKIEPIVKNIDNLHNFFVENEVIIESMDAVSLIEKYSDQEETMIYLDPPYTNSVMGYSSNQITNYNTTQSHLDLLDKCKVFNYVFYSNNVNSDIEKVLDFKVQFSRSNGVSQNKSNVNKSEILGFIDNTVQEPSMPTVEALLSSLNTITTSAPANNVTYKNEASHTLKCATAFSGIGAAEEALKNLHIKHENEFIVEIDKFARETFQANHEVKKVFTDITKLNPKEVPDIDLFVFGSPCQSYSQQGSRLGLEDTRGTLVYNGLKIVKEKAPKYFIYENVKGMVTHDKGHTFKVIKSAFKELNYNIQYEVLNAKHYGAAQNRERLFIVGIRKDIKQKFTFPKPQVVSKTVNDFICNTHFDYTDYVYPAEEAIVHTSKRKSDIQRVFTLPNISYQSDRRIQSTNGISPCILTGSKVKFFDEKNKLFRYLTEQELKEIQGFHKDFNFPVSKSQTRKQIGNSIYVGVLETILENLIPSAYIQEEPLAIAA